MPPDHEYHPLRIVDVVEETSDTRSFVLEIPSTLEETFAYAAGQFCTFRATIDGASVVRCYSMSSSPDTGERLTTTVKRVPGGRMSNWMIDGLAAGDTIDVMRPAGLFVLRETDVPIVAFAGGSGITPAISIIKSALAATTRAIALVYANRNADSVIFADELGRLYMDTVEAGLALLDVSPAQLFIERFVVPEDGNATDEGRATASLVIRLESREHSLGYQAGDTLLEAARRGGLSPPYSCEAGSCATCMAHLDVGSATMRVNNALTPDEVDTGWVLTCQAVPTTPEIVVDYDA
jgi:3-ketosteroid 9alpha-monooxygenase subunit B